MNILHVIDNIGQEYGGSAEVCRKQVKALQKDGHKVTVFFGRPVNYDFTGFDIIHIHNYVTLQNIYTLIKSNGTPVVWQPHGGLVFHQIRHLRSQPFKYLFKNKVSALVAVSEQERDQASEFLPYCKIHMVPNGIDSDDYLDLPERGSFRSEYMPDDARMILYLGRKDWTKNISALFGAYLKHFSHDEDVYLVMVGVNNELCQDGRVITTPPLYGRDKLAAYVDADLFVMPSKYEIFGLTALEAMACGTRVLVSENAGIADFVKSRSWCGDVCKPDIDSLALYISMMLFNDCQVDKFYRRYSALKYDWQTNIKSLENLYCELVG